MNFSSSPACSCWTYIWWLIHCHQSQHVSGCQHWCSSLVLATPTSHLFPTFIVPHSIPRKRSTAVPHSLDQSRLSVSSATSAGPLPHSQRHVSPQLGPTRLAGARAARCAWPRTTGLGTSGCGGAGARGGAAGGAHGVGGGGGAGAPWKAPSGFWSWELGKPERIAVLGTDGLSHYRWLKVTVRGSV